MAQNTEKTYMNVAVEMAKMSKCQSFQVACIIVKEGRIVSTGINGSPPGYRNCCDEFPIADYYNPKERTWSSELTPSQKERHHEWSNLHEIHAEQNAIANAAKHGISIEGATVYCTLKPCMHCTKLLISAGIKSIIYKDIYKRHDINDIDIMLEACGVSIEQFLDVQR